MPFRLVKSFETKEQCAHLGSVGSGPESVAMRRKRMQMAALLSVSLAPKQARHEGPRRLPSRENVRQMVGRRKLYLKQWEEAASARSSSMGFRAGTVDRVSSGLQGIALGRGSRAGARNWGSDASTS